jgi:ABC-type multidrug transport system fused ATPase/permease subunit
LLAAGALSLCSDFVSTLGFRGIASIIAKEIRYDLYICYFSKCAKLHDEIDVDRCKMYFKFSDLEQDIKTMAEKIGKYQRVRSRRVLMSLGSLAGLFYYSWELATVFIVGLLVVLIGYGLSQFCLAKGEAKVSQLKETIRINVVQSFTNKASEFNMKANVFDRINEQVLDSEKDLNCRYASGRFLFLLAVLASKLGVVLYTKFIYVNDQDEGGTALSNATISVQDLASFACFAVLLAWHGS